MDLCAFDQSKAGEIKKVNVIPLTSKDHADRIKKLEKQLKDSTLTIKEAQEFLKGNVQLGTERKLGHLLEQCQNFEDVLQSAATHAVEIGELQKFQQLCKTLDTLRCVVNQLISKKKNLKAGQGKKNVVFEKDSKAKKLHEIKQHANVLEPYSFVDFGSNKLDVNDSRITVTQQSNQSRQFQECFNNIPPTSLKVEDVHKENKSEILQSRPLYQSVPHDISSGYPLVPLPGSHRIQLRNTSQNTLQTFHETEPCQSSTYCNTQKDKMSCQSESQKEPEVWPIQNSLTDQSLQENESESSGTQKNLLYSCKDKERFEKIIQDYTCQITTLKESVLIETEKSNDLQLKYHETKKDLHHAKEMWLKESSRAITCYDLYKETEQKLIEKEQKLINVCNRYKEALNRMHLLQSLLKKEPLQTFHPSLKEYHTIKFSSLSDLTPIAQKMETYDVRSLEKHQNKQMSSFPNSHVYDNKKVYVTKKVTKQAKVLTVLIFENNNVPWMYPTLLNTQKTFLSEMDLTFPQMNEEQHGLLHKIGLSLFLSQGVLYQDDTLQIHYSIVVKESEGSLMFHYKNCLYGNLEGFRMMHDKNLSTQHPLIFYSTPLPDELESKHEMSQRMDFVCSKAYDTIPFVTLCFLLPDTTPRSIQLPLPLPITRFMKGHYLDKETFIKYWQHQDFLLQEITFVIVLHSEILGGSYLSILRKIENNGALEYLQHVQDHVNTFVFSGKLTLKTNSIEPSTPLALVQYQGHHQNQTNLAYMSIRSNSIVLSRALRLVFKLLLGDPTRTLIN